MRNRALPLPRPRALRRLAAIIVAAAALASCARPELVVGLAGSFSGSDYLLGVEGRNAAELFVARANAEGGIAGRRLRLEVRDFRSDPGRIVPADRELLEAGALAIVGHFTSANVEAALPFAEEAGIALVSPTATGASLDGRDDVFFRTIMSSREDASVLVGEMRGRGLGRLLLVATAGNRAYVETYLAPARALLPPIGEIVYAGLDELGERRLAAYSAADAVLVVASPLDTATAAQRLRLSGSRAAIFASGWAANPDLVEHGGSAVDGAVFVHQVDPGIPTLRPFAEAYRAAYGEEPSFAAIETWDAFLLVRAAIEAGGVDRASFLAAIRGIREVRGISATIRLDSFGDARRPLYLKEVRDGAIRVVKEIALP